MSKSKLLSKHWKDCVVGEINEEIAQPKQKFEVCLKCGCIEWENSNDDKICIACGVKQSAVSAPTLDLCEGDIEKLNIRTYDNMVLVVAFSSDIKHEAERFSRFGANLFEPLRYKSPKDGVVEDYFNSSFRSMASYMANYAERSKSLRSMILPDNNLRQNFKPEEHGYSERLIWHEREMRTKKNYLLLPAEQGIRIYNSLCIESFDRELYMKEQSYARVLFQELKNLGSANITIGKTGSGKTTAMPVILKYLDPITETKYVASSGGQECDTITSMEAAEKGLDLDMGIDRDSGRSYLPASECFIYEKPREEADPRLAFSTHDGFIIFNSSAELDTEKLNKATEQTSMYNSSSDTRKEDDEIVTLPLPIEELGSVHLEGVARSHLRAQGTLCYDNISKTVEGHSMAFDDYNEKEVIENITRLIEEKGEDK